MPATERATDSIVASLLERLAQVAEFSEACSILLDGAAAACDIQRAVVLVSGPAGVRGVAIGVPADALERLLREVEIPGSRSASLLEPRDEPLLDPGILQNLDFAGAALIPFPAGPGWDRALVALEADCLDGRTALAGEIFHRCGPALGRVGELERLRQHERKTSRQRDLLSAIIEGLPDPILLTDPQNDILLANRRADQLLVGTPEDSEGRSRAIQINNLLFSSFLTQGVIGNPSPIGRELNLVDPSDGSDLLFEVLSAPLPSHAAGEGTVISILRDITDLKRAVSELETQFNRSRVAEHDARRERDQLNVVLENVGDPILVTDDQSNIILMNPEADRLFVVPPNADPADEPKWRLVRANDTVFTTMISDLLIHMEHGRTGKVELIDPETARRFPAEVISSKILNSRGEPTAIVSVIHDLTQFVENERLAEELRKLNDELEDRIRHATEELEEHNRRLAWQSSELQRASRLKSEFLANMSHELRTPINVVLGYTSLMRERIYGELTPQQEESLGKVYATSQHLLELINDILDLSKIEAGKMPLHVDDVPLESLLDEISEAVRPMLRKKGIGYGASVHSDVPTLRTDRTKLRQILLNLVTNAIKFTHQGEVTVTADAVSSDSIRIEVRDTGIGIRQEDIETIFEDFRQVDQSHTREYGGTGLGLSITKKLLKLLGGTVSVTSTYGEGSRFVITIPTEITAVEDAGEPEPIA